MFLNKCILCINNYNVLFLKNGNGFVNDLALLKSSDSAENFKT